MIIFITGIDTGIGKTIATGRLAAWFEQQGMRTVTQKPVQTGCEGPSEDIALHRKLMGCGWLPADREGLTCPQIFPLPASPHLAASLAGETIDSQRLAGAARTLAERFDLVLVEGAGGLHVPLTEELLTIDWVRREQWPVILVTAPRLGSINHTLLSLEALRHRDMHLSAVIYNMHFDASPPIVADTRKLIRRAIDSMQADAPLIELPADLSTAAHAPWTDPGLPQLLQLIQCQMRK